MNDLVALNLEMIVTIVDGGIGEDVIDYSKKAGASGGRFYMDVVLESMTQENS